MMVMYSHYFLFVSFCGWLLSSLGFLMAGQQYASLFSAFVAVLTFAAFLEGVWFNHE